MNAIKQHWKPIVAGVVVAVLLAAVFWWGGDAPGLQGWQTQSAASTSPVPSAEQTAEPGALTDKLVSTAEASAVPTASAEGQTQPVPSDSESGVAVQRAEEPQPDERSRGAAPVQPPVPAEPQEAERSDELTCTLSVRCDSIWDNIGWLKPEKKKLIPSDGVIFPAQTVVFYEGESVFNVLVREMKKNKIHLEFTNTPLYNSAYIEGISNIYEFDCGGQSGWIYQVNGQRPDYGCSRYQLKPGDRVEWIYSCSLGAAENGAAVELIQ